MYKVVYWLIPAVEIQKVNCIYLTAYTSAFRKQKVNYMNLKCSPTLINLEMNSFGTNSKVATNKKCHLHTFITLTLSSTFYFHNLASDTSDSILLSLLYLCYK